MISTDPLLITEMFAYAPAPHTRSLFLVGHIFYTQNTHTTKLFTQYPLKHRFTILNLSHLPDLILPRHTGLHDRIPYLTLL